MHSRFSQLVLAASVLALTACGGKKGTTQPPVTTASITVTAGSPTLSVAQGAAGTSAITVGRTSYSGDVTLTAENLPTGVTAAFTPATLSAGATASSLALTVSGTAALTSTNITVRARGTGVTDATASVALTVSAVVGGGVSIALNPTTASITAGQTAQTAVAITKTGGFAGGVNMTVTGAPTGMTTTFSTSNPVTAATVNLSVATLTSVTPGPYTLTVRANSAGLTEATATYVVTVGAPPSNSVNWRFCDTDLYPTWFAYQDGASGSWQQVTATSPGLYNFAYGQPQIGIATVSTILGKTVTSIRYFGLSEVTAAAAAECTTNPAQGTKSLTGTITGFGQATEVGLVSMGNALSSSTNSSQTGFTISNVPTGALDLVAIRADIVSSSTLRVLLQRGINPASGTSLGALDLAGGASFAPVSSSITVNAPNDGPIQAQARFTTATGSGASFTTAQLATGVAGTYQGIPVGSLLATDLQQVQASQQVGTTLNRFITQYIRGPAPVTLNMQADPGAPTLTSVASAPYARATISGAVPAAFNGIVRFSLEQSAGPRIWTISATPAGRGGSATSYSFTMPDFTAAAGWQNTWGLIGGNTSVTSSFFGSTGAGTDGAPVTGAVFFTNSRLGSFTFP